MNGPFPADGRARPGIVVRADGSEVDCADVVLRLFEYIDNEAQEADCGWIQAHLQECASCLRQHDSDVRVKELVRRACGCETAPDTLRGEILSRITRVSVREDAEGTSVSVTDVTEVRRTGGP